MKAALFVTCTCDQAAPHAGAAVVRVLRRLGVEVTFPAAQTCCGQPAFNAGYPRDACAAAATLLDAFADVPYVVSPSGSCVGMVRHGFPELFADDPAALARARDLAARTYEFSQFVVGVLGRADVGATFPHRVTYHPSCHATRILGVRDEPLELLRHVRGLELAPLVRAEDCCGFGGTFAVKMADLAGAMVAEKADHVLEAAAPYLVGTDMGCLLNIGGHLARRGAAVEVLHLAELLDRGMGG